MNLLVDAEVASGPHSSNQFFNRTMVQNLLDTLNFAWVKIFRLAREEKYAPIAKRSCPVEDSGTLSRGREKKQQKPLALLKIDPTFVPCKAALISYGLSAWLSLNYFFLRDNVGSKDRNASYIN